MTTRRSSRGFLRAFARRHARSVCGPAHAAQPGQLRLRSVRSGPSHAGRTPDRRAARPRCRSVLFAGRQMDRFPLAGRHAQLLCRASMLRSCPRAAAQFAISRKIRISPSMSSAAAILSPGRATAALVLHWRARARTICWCGRISPAAASKRMADRAASAPSFTPDLARAVFLKSAATGPPEITLLEGTARNAAHQSRGHGCRLRYTAQPKVVSWKSRDGLAIEGVLFLPFRYHAGHGGFRCWWNCTADRPAWRSTQFPVPRTYPTQAFLRKRLRRADAQFPGIGKLRR